METAPEAFHLPKRTPPRGQAFLVVLYGPELGRRALVGRSTFEIGRQSKCELAIDQESVSRRHARISYAQGTHYIEDLGSRNGTVVGDTRIDGRHPLRHGDQIKIGESILKYMAGSDDENTYHEEIYRLMTVDPLTQAYNKRYFHEVLEREQNRSTRYKRDLSLLMFDVDRFKELNDTYGHVAGDEVLKQLSYAIKAKLRAQDVFARVGGEEFAVLLPEIGLVGARVTAEKVRTLCELTPITHEQQTITTTVSVGVATLGEGCSTATELLKVADERLYEAKRAGRNRVAG
jgi:diguanylate cyclase (GGDEF)-like protein